MGEYGWGGARPGSGRPKGRIDSRPREIREAMLGGAMDSDYGLDPDHPDEPGDLRRFFKNMANKNLDLFSQMLIKLIPRQINTQVESTIGVDVVFHTLEEVRAEMERQGMTQQQIKQIQAMLPMPINDDARDDVEMLDRNRDD
jgi:hypothetical protein